jgi:hypothetical protein
MARLVRVVVGRVCHSAILTRAETHLSLSSHTHIITPALTRNYLSVYFLDVATKVKPILEISRRALLARVERALRHKHRQLRADRRGRGLNWVLIDTDKGVVVEVEIDVDELAKKLQVLRSWERVAAPSRHRG